MTITNFKSRKEEKKKDMSATICPPPPPRAPHLKEDVVMIPIT